MKREELKLDESCKKTIEQFVGSKFFLLIKDAFVTDIKDGEKESVAASTSDSLILSHGRHLEAIAVFQKLQEIADHKAPPPETKKREAGQQDPDLR